jgi:hypothetical protein
MGFGFDSGFEMLWGKSSFDFWFASLCEGGAEQKSDVCSQLGFVEEQKCSLSG